MNEKDIVTAAMKTCGWTQEELAVQAGYKTQSAISNRLNGKSMRVDTFVKLLASMGYEVLVRSTSPNTNKNKWIITANKSEESSVENDSQKIDLDSLLSSDEQEVKQAKKWNKRVKLL